MLSDENVNIVDLRNVDCKCGWSRWFGLWFVISFFPVAIGGLYWCITSAQCPDWSINNNSTIRSLTHFVGALSLSSFVAGLALFGFGIPVHTVRSAPHSPIGVSVCVHCGYYSWEWESGEGSFISSLIREWKPHCQIICKCLKTDAMMNEHENSNYTYPQHKLCQT